MTHPALADAPPAVTVITLIGKKGIEWKWEMITIDKLLTISPNLVPIRRGTPATPLWRVSARNKIFILHTMYILTSSPFVRPVFKVKRLEGGGEIIITNTSIQTLSYGGITYVPTGVITLLGTRIIIRAPRCDLRRYNLVISLSRPFVDYNVDVELTVELPQRFIDPIVGREYNVPDRYAFIPFILIGYGLVDPDEFEKGLGEETGDTLLFAIQRMTGLSIEEIKRALQRALRKQLEERGR